ncbi:MULTISPECIES: exodeoxyribonuclease VII large subunit [Lactiplantibacillus]|uniref:Exodeoxyribonuclease 7 large subunit n=1 Tax=Lactiplantibacillus pentosus TaxID=1589 RepID=A0A2S9W3K4_LACPE|nr:MULTISPECIES: exodeoxyribonuclease VII large subunit [Lactiplantibacillus]MBU7448121.1 exodeoxyribonuclease VII large subunit [Lactiplantibacillus sp. 7.2.4]MBU7483609.1 exodeoxyribonuclease VII large subunit [Lactiplantibacillus sp. 30.2.29]MCH4129671.1 exodeoxyribonuclease VII large subunit [Lactiplantibacillus sp.]BBM20229.1 exodeoxyribonuclease VII large subunit [Lactiplantibacillus plantarum]MBU7460863.1 exodeoxyribonuclease VII large subunit [Lactiplantibacillus pentosus]
MSESQQYLTVSALTQYIKRKFEVDPYLGKVYLTGEVSNYRPRPNTHQYFSLKDDHAKISAIMFKSAFAKVKFQPEEGMKVLVVGRIGLYEPSGSYQIYVERMEPDGVGALYQAYEQLKKKLAAEGLFSAPKKPLPRFPKRIAVVTSRSGAVIRDIITTARRRFPIAQIVLFPAQVQGDAAAAEISRQIERANAQGDFDTLIIGRGGGSIEDLWPFNEEVVARAIAQSQLPVISSVGHETDTTIADLVADVRAATPTAAAELAVPVYNDVLLQLKQDQTRVLNAFQNLVQRDRQRLNKLTASYVFTQPNRLYEGYLQKLDFLNERLKQAGQNQLNVANQQYQRVFQQLRQQTPIHQVRQAQTQLANLEQRLNRSTQLVLRQKRQQLTQTVQSLDLLSPLKIMTRGYAFVTAEDQVIHGVKQLQPQQTVTIHMTDGEAEAQVTKIDGGK